MLEDKILKQLRKVLKSSDDLKVTPRIAAYVVALQRIADKYHEAGAD